MFNPRAGMANYSGAPIMGQRGMRVLQGQFVEHGSMELDDDARRNRRNRSRDRPGGRASTTGGAGVRTGPAGPQERMEWMEALENCRQRISTIEASNRNLAQSCAHVEHVTRQHTDKLSVLEEDYPKYKAWVSEVLFKHPQSVDHQFTNIQAKVEDLMNVNAQLIGNKMQETDLTISNIEASLGALFAT